MTDESEQRSQLVELRRKFVGLKWEMDELRQEMQLLEAHAMVRVAETRDDRGSPLYSTQEVRRAAARAQLAENPAFVMLRDRFRGLQRDIDLLLLDIQEVQSLLPPEWLPPDY